jgi:ABC-type antimicrobial peptide transport system permease subunit
VAAALKRNSLAIEDVRKAIAAETSDKRPMLENDLAKLQAMAAPSKRLQLLHDYLAERRRELEQRKGGLDQQLQQERAGRDQEPQASTMTTASDAIAEPSAPSAAPRAGVIGFLRQMSATDKWLAILALLVCFVGIVNAMLMTVQERFREIGTMKCLGALDSFIVKIFLLESAALGFIGTLLGILIGLLLSTGRQVFVYGIPVFSYFPLLNLLIAGALAAIVGLLLSIVAAILPARNAARMEPVEAMRMEE